MPPKTVEMSVSQLRTGLTKDQLNRIGLGEEIVRITRGGFPIARIVADRPGDDQSRGNFWSSSTRTTTITEPMSTAENSGVSPIDKVADNATPVPDASDWVATGTGEKDPRPLKELEAAAVAAVKTTDDYLKVVKALAAIKSWHRRLTKDENERYQETFRALGAAQREEAEARAAKEQSVMNRMASDDDT